MELPWLENFNENIHRVLVSEGKIRNVTEILFCRSILLLESTKVWM